MLFYIIYAVWLLSEILLNRLLRAGKTDKKGTDKRTLPVIWITIVAAIAVSVFLSINYSMPVSDNNTIPFIGLFIIVAGMILRLAAVFTLGNLFTVDITIRQHHRLKKDGLYKYIRHPSYAGSLLSFIGFGLSLNNWLSLLIAAVPVLIVFAYRINVEEAMLTKAMGETYTKYKKHTWRLLPLVY